MTTVPSNPTQPIPAAPANVPPAGAGFVQGALFGALLTATLIGVLLWFLWQPTPAPMTLTPPRVQELIVVPESAATQAPALITVYVSGAVVAPGLYELPAAARLAAAIEAAGGYAPDANADALNLASLMQDGARLHVPSINEVVAAPAAGVSESPARVVGVELSGAEAPINAGAPINVNLASLEQLQQLPGIGAVKAQAIIDNRPYATVDDLDRVSGIGPATIEDLRALVTTN